MSGNLQEAAEQYAREMGLNTDLLLTGGQVDASSGKELNALLKDAITNRKNVVFSSITEN